MRAATLCLQVEHGAIDDLHGVAVTDLRVRLDVGDQQLDRAQVAGDRLARARCVRYDGNRLECCVPGRIDDQVGAADLFDQPRVHPDLDRAGSSSEAPAPDPRRTPDRSTGPSGTRQQEDVADVPGVPRGDDRLLGREDSSVVVYPHEPGVLAVRHVLDEARRQAHEGAVVVDRGLKSRSWSRYAPATRGCRRCSRRS